MQQARLALMEQTIIPMVQDVFSEMELYLRKLLNNSNINMVIDQEKINTLLQAKSNV